jgi:hypothetical protein
MNYKTLGYRNGFVFLQAGKNVYRADYVDNSACHWYAPIKDMARNCHALGNLEDENGNEIKNQFKNN